MKICLVSQEYPDELSGGIGSYTAGMAKALADAGHDVHVLARSPTMQRTYRDRNVTVHKISPRLLNYAFVRRYCGNLVYSAYVAMAVNGLIRKTGIEVIEMPEFAAEGFIYSIQPNRPVPVVVRLHAPLKIVDKINQTRHSWGGWLYVGFLNWMERTLILRADRVTSPSLAMAKMCRKELRLGNLPIEVFPNPVDTEYFTRGSDSEQKEDDEHTILYAGQLGMRKGVDVFREVIPSVLKICPKARFLFVGAEQGYSGGKMMREYILEPLTEEQRQRIRFLGKRPWSELRELYRFARVCVFPSRFENFPQVCLEAMACGCAVIGSSSGGMAEIISDGIDGFLVRPGDAATISDRICHCLTKDVEELCKAARRRIVTAFGLKPVAAHASELFQQVASRTEERAQLSGGVD